MLCHLSLLLLMARFMRLTVFEQRLHCAAIPRFLSRPHALPDNGAVCLCFSMGTVTHVKVSPSEPKYLHFRFPPDQETVVVLMNSEDELCMILSIQDIKVSHNPPPPSQSPLPPALSRGRLCVCVCVWGGSWTPVCVTTRIMQPSFDAVIMLYSARSFFL